MKNNSTLLRWFLALCCLASFTARAQFYSPKTEFHDKVQRLFPVELVRVLLAREGTAAVARVTFDVTNSPDGATSWNIQAQDKENKAIKTYHVSYPASLLTNGPTFYRSVFKQVWSQGHWRSEPEHSAADLSANFWRGADLNGMNREDGLHAAFKLQSTNAAELAGLLANIPLPGIAGTVTLDATLLARGGAWLALAESTAKPETLDDQNWAPIIFMSGREYAAFDLWKSKVKNLSKPNDPAMYRFWDFFLRRPKARASFEFAAANPDVRKFAMPMLVYYSRTEQLWNAFVDCSMLIYGQRPEDLTKLYSYGTFFSDATTIAGGRLLEGAFPAIFREQWLKLLKEFPANPADDNSYREKLQNISESTSDSAERPEDYSLVGLKKCAPLLQLGYQHGEGDMIPTTTVTARDLLNYGWEMNGLMMGARYFFVNKRWGIPDLAATIFKKATLGVEGEAPFFNNNFQYSAFNFQQSLYRLQFVDGIWWRCLPLANPFTVENTNAPVAAELFYKRVWVDPMAIRQQGWTICQAGHPEERDALFERAHKEGGPRSDVVTVEAIQDWFNNTQLQSQPKLKQIKSTLAHGFNEPCQLQTRALYSELYSSKQLSPGKRALAYEKLFWQNPDCGLEGDIFNNYVEGVCWKSAGRFYEQCREICAGDITFQNNVTPKAWNLGYLEGDEKLMDDAFEDSSSGSYHAMMTCIWHYFAHDQINKAEQQIDELILRYEPNGGPDSSGRMMKEFLPLLPALANKNDPHHEQALDHWGKSANAIILRWILIKKDKLPTDEAIRFLGGAETDVFRHVLITALQNDTAHINDAYGKYVYSNSESGGRVFTAWIWGHMLNIKKDITEKDLKPADAKSITQAVMDTLKKSKNKPSVGGI